VLTLNRSELFGPFLSLQGAAPIGGQLFAHDNSQKDCAASMSRGDSLKAVGEPGAVDLVRNPHPRDHRRPILRNSDRLFAVAVGYHNGSCAVQASYENVDPSIGSGVQVSPDRMGVFPSARLVDRLQTRVSGGTWRAPSLARPAQHHGCFRLDVLGGKAGVLEQFRIEHRVRHRVPESSVVGLISYLLGVDVVLVPADRLIREPGDLG
jgi:hypothetical protein